jgi:hypothetical protein
MGPRTRMEALIVLTMSYVAVVPVSVVVSIFSVFSSRVYSAPRFPSNFKNVLMSATAGIFVILTGFDDRIVAARSGSEAFLAPEILIEPLSLLPPYMSK